MKQLIIGIDGGTRDIFERMPMPFLHERIHDYSGPELEIDLLSRGWAEQISGTYAHAHKGFYVFPKLDGTRDFLFKYSLDDLVSHTDVTPIWDMVGQKGAKVGIMNIPTTFPAPEVDGFFVSGAGGGLNKVEGIPSAMCFPQSLCKDLADLGYILDIRLGTSEISSLNKLFNELMKMAEIRTSAFLTSCKGTQPDFSFLVFRHLSVIQYLGMSEIEAYLDQEQKRQVSEVWQNRLEEFYSHFDGLLRKITETLNPEHLIFSSDHGIGSTKEYCNPNAFLQDNGYQKKRINVGPSVRRLGGAIKRIKKPSLSYCIDWKKTKAFADWYSSCIYINDLERFGGSVNDCEIDLLVDQICDDFNNHSETVDRGIVALPYRRYYKQSRYYNELADVRIVHKQSIFVASKNGSFFSKNPNYGPIPSLPSQVGGMHTGNKTMYPFFVTDSKTAKLIKDDDPNDLTLVYKLTERIFSTF